MKKKSVPNLYGALTAMLDIIIAVSLLALLTGAIRNELPGTLSAILALLLVVALLRSTLTFVLIRVLKWQACHDPVTRLPNQQAFLEDLSTLLANPKIASAAVYLINIDRFKLFIGSLGYLTCNRLLAAVATRLCSALDHSLTRGRLYRFEADTFAVLVHSRVNPEQLAHQLLETLHQPVYVNHREFCVTVSVGFSLYPQDGRESTALLHAADLALQEAKQKGGNSASPYSHDLEHPISQPLTLEGYLRHAIDFDELELYFQPQVALDNGRLCGAEITLRWHHPDDQLLQPQDFIPLAEEAGLIGPITEWIMEQTCRQLLAWHQDSIDPIRLAVNISAQQFHQQQLPQLLQRLLKKFAIDPEWLELEITESVAMLDVDHSAKILKRLKSLGLHLALDDFGTGYSSFSYLRLFPLDTLKLDRSFITPIERDLQSAAIVRGIISLGHSLDLKILAEGIETKGQLEFLARNGCDEGQGFLFGKPMPAATFQTLLKKKSPVILPLS